MSCEAYELELSALADGEVDAEALAPVLDHLAACPSCRTFWQQVRALDDAVALAGMRGEPAPSRIWREVARETSLSRPAVPPWALKLAAAVVLGVSLWGLGVVRLAFQLPLGDEVEVRVGSRPGSMSDADFVRLTTRLLEADHRYHVKMLQVLRAVDGPALAREASEEGSPLRASLAADRGGDTRAATPARSWY